MSSVGVSASKYDNGGTGGTELVGAGEEMVRKRGVERRGARHS
jgi:hypothetical protein